MHYAHTSHGSQLMTGAQWWELQNATYSIYVRVGGTPALSPDTTAFRIYDGNNPDTYITPELYWSTDDGKNRTRWIANTGLFNYSMWAWCGQQSSNSTATVQQYLDTMNQFEQHVRNNSKVLFDFADIETYNASGGGPYYNDANGYCQRCDAWCTGHPSDCANFNRMGDCAHTHKLFLQTEVRGVLVDDGASSGLEWVAVISRRGALRLHPYDCFCALMARKFWLRKR